MVFDDNFFKLTNGSSVSNNDEYKPFSSVSEELSEIDINSLDSPDSSESTESAESETTDKSEDEDKKPKLVMADLSDAAMTPKWASELGNYDQDYVIESDLVIPNIKPVKEENSIPNIVVIDDDFDTLDLLKIYLARGYEYAAFHNPKDAIFYLNEHIPDLILLDCNIHAIKAQKIIDIIRSYKYLANTPIIYTCDEFEKAVVMASLPEQISGVLTRPISRGNLQYILDKFVLKK